jgi:hypothetical protein
MKADLQGFIVPRNPLYLLHHVLDRFEKVRTLDVELVLRRLGLVVVLLWNGSNDDETIPRPLFVVSHERASLRDDFRSSVPVLPTAPSRVVVVNALRVSNIISLRNCYDLMGGP